jgi:alkylated DNA nucleotide flippase Atl1
MDEDREEARDAMRDLDETSDQPPDFIDQVMETVRSIPPGRVMTYGDIAVVLTARAERAGRTDSYGPRMVGHVMSWFGAALPWWRVIRSTGHPPRFHHERAWPFYQEEGTPLLGDRDNYRIDLRRARFDPDDPDDPPRQDAP